MTDDDGCSSLNEVAGGGTRVRWIDCGECGGEEEYDEMKNQVVIVHWLLINNFYKIEYIWWSMDYLMSKKI